MTSASSSSSAMAKASVYVQCVLCSAKVKNNNVFVVTEICSLKHSEF